MDVHDTLLEIVVVLMVLVFETRNNAISSLYIAFLMLLG
jgi:hypothetical protein